MPGAQINTQEFSNLKYINVYIKCRKRSINSWSKIVYRK